MGIVNKITSDGNTIALWNFNEGSGTTAADSVGGKTLTLTSAPWDTTDILKSVDFAGTSGSYGTATNPSSITDNLTIECIYKWDGGSVTNADHSLVCWGGNTGTSLQHTSGGSMSIRELGVNTSSYGGWYPYTVGVWHYFAASRISGVWTLYYNGVLATPSNSSASPTAASAFSVGGNVQAGVAFSDVHIASIRLSNVGRTQAQLDAMYLYIRNNPTSITSLSISDSPNSITAQSLAPTEAVASNAIGDSLAGVLTSGIYTSASTLVSDAVGSSIPVLLTIDPLVRSTWVQVGATNFTSTKYEYSLADSVDAGGYIFEPGSGSMDKIQVATSFVIHNTGGGYAISQDVSTSPGPLFVCSWASFDKRQPFSVEAEVWNDGDYRDIDLIVYPDESRYSQSPKSGGWSYIRTDDGSGPPGATYFYYGGHGYSDLTNNWTIDPAYVWPSVPGLWIKIRVDYSVVGTDAFVTSYQDRGSGWEISSTAPFGNFADNYSFQFPNPAIGLFQFNNANTSYGVSFRNFKVRSGILAAYSVSPNRIAGTMAAGQVKVVGSTTWTYYDARRTRNGSVECYNYQDATGGWYIWNGTSNVEVEYPGAYVPIGKFPAQLCMRGSNIDWRIVNKVGTTLISGTVTAGEKSPTIDLSSIQGTNYIQPLVTLKDSSSVVRWLDLSWDLLIVPTAMATGDSPSGVTLFIVRAAGSGLLLGSNY